MNGRAMLVVLGLLAGCGLRADPPPPPLVSIAEGRYGATINAACVTLNFGRRGRQSIAVDGNCDGQGEFQSSFELVENVIVFEIGTFTVTAVGGVSFSGLWSQGDAVTEARFERVDL